MSCAMGKVIGTLIAIFRTVIFHELHYANVLFGDWIVKKLLIFSVGFFAFVGFSMTGFAAKNSVTNVRAFQRSDGTNYVDIYYDLNASDPRICEVSYSIDGGSTFSESLTSLSGEIGENVAPGNNKHIVWDAGSILPDVITKCKIRIRGIFWVGYSKIPQSLTKSVPEKDNGDAEAESLLRSIEPNKKIVTNQTNNRNPSDTLVDYFQKRVFYRIVRQSDSPPFQLNTVSETTDTPEENTSAALLVPGVFTQHGGDCWSISMSIQYDCEQLSIIVDGYNKHKGYLQPDITLTPVNGGDPIVINEPFPLTETSFRDIYTKTIFMTEWTGGEYIVSGTIGGWAGGQQWSEFVVQEDPPVTIKSYCEPCTVYASDFLSDCESFTFTVTGNGHKPSWIYYSLEFTPVSGGTVIPLNGFVQIIYLNETSNPIGDENYEMANTVNLPIGEYSLDGTFEIKLVDYVPSPSYSSYSICSIPVNTECVGTGTPENPVNTQLVHAPTLDEWGMIVFFILLVTVSISKLRSTHPHS